MPDGQKRSSNLQDLLHMKHRLVKVVTEYVHTDVNTSQQSAAAQDVAKHLAGTHSNKDANAKNSTDLDTNILQFGSNADNINSNTQPLNNAQSFSIEILEEDVETVDLDDYELSSMDIPQIIENEDFPDVNFETMMLARATPSNEEMPNLYVPNDFDNNAEQCHQIDLTDDDHLTSPSPLNDSDDTTLDFILIDQDVNLQEETTNSQRLAHSQKINILRVDTINPPVNDLVQLRTNVSQDHTYLQIEELAVLSTYEDATDKVSTSSQSEHDATVMDQDYIYSMSNKDTSSSQHESCDKTLSDVGDITFIEADSDLQSNPVETSDSIASVPSISEQSLLDISKKPSKDIDVFENEKTSNVTNENDISSSVNDSQFVGVEGSPKSGMSNIDLLQTKQQMLQLYDQVPKVVLNSCEMQICSGVVKKDNLHSVKKRKQPLDSAVQEPNQTMGDQNTPPQKKAKAVVTRLELPFLRSKTSTLQRDSPVVRSKNSHVRPHPPPLGPKIPAGTPKAPTARSKASTGNSKAPAGSSKTLGGKLETSKREPQIPRTITRNQKARAQIEEKTTDLTTIEMESSKSRTKIAATPEVAMSMPENDLDKSQGLEMSLLRLNSPPPKLETSSQREESMQGLDVLLASHSTSLSRHVGVITFSPRFEVSSLELSTSVSAPEISSSTSTSNLDQACTSTPKKSTLKSKIPTKEPEIPTSNPGTPLSSPESSSLVLRSLDEDNPSLPSTSFDTARSESDCDSTKLQRSPEKPSSSWLKKDGKTYRKCQICMEQVLDIKKHLEIHKTHTFVCEVCGKSYIRKTHLTQHIGRCHPQMLR